MEAISKKRFAAMVRIWINHKKAIAENSESSYYRNAGILKSFSKINDLFKLATRDCSEFNLNDLYKMVIINEPDLRNILPAMRNLSYNSQLEKLEFILTTAKQNKK